MSDLTRPQAGSNPAMKSEYAPQGYWLSPSARTAASDGCIPASRSPVRRIPHSVSVPVPPLKLGELGSQPIWPAAATTGDGVRVSARPGRWPVSRLRNIRGRDDVRATLNSPLSCVGAPSRMVVHPPAGDTVAAPRTRPGFGALAYVTLSVHPAARSWTTTFPPAVDRCAYRRSAAPAMASPG